MKCLCRLLTVVRWMYVGEEVTWVYEHGKVVKKFVKQSGTISFVGSAPYPDIGTSYLMELVRLSTGLE